MQLSWFFWYYLREDKRKDRQAPMAEIELIYLNEENNNE